MDNPYCDLCLLYWEAIEEGAIEEGWEGTLEVAWQIAMPGPAVLA